MLYFMIWGYKKYAPTLLKCSLAVILMVINHILDEMKSKRVLLSFNSLPCEKNCYAKLR